jgi:putative PIN family toxin of toxin-antitoxin system
MSPEPRYVFDTNAVVSALLFEQSPPGRALHAAIGRGRVLLSDATFAELSEVLARPRFDRYVAREQREQFLVTFLRDATLVQTPGLLQACRDPKDDKFLDLAVHGNASCIVTGDQDLLVLHPFRGIPILTPAQFLDSLAEESHSPA